MGHSLILGMTESGKTTMAKSLAKSYKDSGISVLVLDPLTDPDWHADYQTDNPDDFLNVVWQSRSCAIFIDEAGESVGQYDVLMSKTATRGRHWGHSCHYISQRGAQLSRTVRDQCSNLFLFTTALGDCKIHADEWNNQELKTASSLQKGHYFYTTRFGDLKKGRLF